MNEWSGVREASIPANAQWRGPPGHGRKTAIAAVSAYFLIS